MHWLLAIFGMFLGALVSNGQLFGVVFGSFLGWLLGKQIDLSRRLNAAQEQLDWLEQLRTAESAVAGDAQAPTPVPAQHAQPVVRTPVAPQAAPVAGDSAASWTPVPPSAPAVAPIAAAVVPPPADIATDVSEGWSLAPVEQPAAPQLEPDSPTPAYARASEPARFATGIDPSTPPPYASTPDPTGASAPRPSYTARTASTSQDSPPPNELVRWFFAGNPAVKIGMGVLFLGVAALLKYAADQGWLSVPIEVRLALIAAGAIGALIFGWRQREQRRIFGLSVQGGAIGILLLTVFAAYKLYHLLPAGMAFGLFVSIVAGGAMLAVLQDALALAVLAFVGGYLAPVLISTGSGNYVALFSYYAVLNAAVFGVAWVRPWRALNLVGFAFTFGVGLAWGQQYYQPQFLSTVEPFLVLFFLFYVAIAVLYALRQPLASRGLVDGTLVFGTPLLAFPLQAALLQDDKMSLAFSALAMAGIYGGLSAWILRREGLRLLGESFAALAFGFATLAVPIALSARWTSCTWALEGAALVWLGLRQQRQMPVYSGVLLQILAAGAFAITVFENRPADGQAILNGEFLAGALLALSALFSSYRFERSEEWPRFSLLTFLAGWYWWSVTGVREISDFVAHSNMGHSLLLFFAGTMAVAALLRGPMAWPRLAWPVLFGFVFTLLSTHMAWDQGALHDLGSLAWPAAIAIGWMCLWLLRDDPPRGLSLAHVAWLGTVAIIASFELHAHAVAITGDSTSWALVALIAPLTAMVWFSLRAPERFGAPLGDVFSTYRERWDIPALLAIALWWAMSLLHDGDATPLAFVPLLNPLELTQLMLLILGGTMLRERSGDDDSSTLAAGLLLVGFVFVSVATLRAVHHLVPLPWDQTLFNEMVAQTSLTVVWSVIGVSAWIAGSKRGSRAVWLCGAVIMGVVLVKLALVDRQHMGNIAGIVSFIAVGLLLTVVGYFAPSPPREAALEGSR